MDYAELIKMLWQTAFAVTGFAVVQAIAYVYSTENEELRPKIVRRIALVKTMIVVCHVLYVGAVVWCHIILFTIGRKAILQNSELLSYFHYMHVGIGIGQAVLIAGFGLFAFSITVRMMNEDGS